MGRYLVGEDLQPDAENEPPGRLNAVASQMGRNGAADGPKGTKAAGTGRAIGGALGHQF